MNVTTTILTCHTRVEEALLTASQADAFGLESRVVLEDCEPPRVENVLRGAWRAMQMAREEGTGLLFLEDDVDFSRHFPTFLQMAVENDLLTTFIVFRDSLYPDGFETAAMYAEGKARGQLVRLHDGRVAARRGFHGSQALYLPPRVLEAASEDRGTFVREDGLPLEPLRNEKRFGFDFWLKDRAADFGGIFAAYPNPVQHRNRVPSSFGGKGVFRSRSHNLQPVWLDK